MRKYLYSLLGISALLLPSCARDLDRAVEEERSETSVVYRQEGRLRTEGAIPGVVHIRLNRNAMQQVSLSSHGAALRSSATLLAQSLNEIETAEFEPMFAMDSRYEKRMRAAGLDQWFVVRFNDKKDLENAIRTLEGAPEIDIVEPVFAATLPDVVPIPAKEVLRSDASDIPFNDLRLHEQWHYSNKGGKTRHIAGADINLFEAWKTTTGKSNVIVAIVDGGIDVSHPDLIDNLWINKAEQEGEEGKDDDGNGFIDDVYGFNFISNDANIYPDAVSHGTHVAGTVGARNNNGIGVCGVAGGDHEVPGTGVKMISCQTFGKKKGQGMESGNSAAAIVYGANNGAVISQNSWGYEYPGLPTLPKSMQDAIDYFIKYAGCDNEGNQLPDSPMKGGVVIFAAGNDGKDYLGYPGAYAPAIAVSSMAPDWKMAFYSNRGAWVDIMAPGGETRIPGGGVLSTLAYDVVGSEYGYMQGTSMACPHVSGVAALIVSHFGGQGFTNKELEKRLVGSFRPKNIDLVNPDYVGRIGRGYIDAGKIFAVDNLKSPNTVSDLAPQDVSFLTTTVSWSAVADLDDGAPVEYLLYLSKSPITTANYTNVYCDKVNAIDFEVGAKMTYKFKALEENTSYYCGIIAVDRWGHTSDLVVKEFKTLKNTAPTLASSMTDPIRVFGARKVQFTVTGSDVDNQNLLFEISGDTKGVAYSIKGNVVSFAVSAAAPIGSYKIYVTVTDELGAKATMEIPFEVYKYIAPTFSSTIGSQVIGVNGRNEFDLTALIENPNQNLLTYTAISLNGAVLTATVSAEGKLELKGLKVGVTRVTIEGTDGVSPFSMGFTVRVAENADDAIYSVYPIPAKTALNVSLNPRVSKIRVEIYSIMGARVYKEEYSDTSNSDNLRIDVRRLTPGVYTLKATATGKAYTKTFTKV